jgi:hypothetical protein
MIESCQASPILRQPRFTSVHSSLDGKGTENGCSQRAEAVLISNIDQMASFSHPVHHYKETLLVAY